MTIIRSVGVLSVAKIMGCVYGLLGLILGGLFSLLSLAGAAAGGGGGAGILFGVGAVIILPLFYGMIGFIGGLITALIYNLVASNIGGIEVELSEGYSRSSSRRRTRSNDDYEEDDDR